jgi:hypothetical protein
MQINIRDAAAGGIFILIAALFALGTQDLAIGTTLRMGPGYFPLLLAGVLGLLGLLIVIKSIGKAQSPISGVSWRGAALILLAPIVFGLTVRGFPTPFGFRIPALGLAPSVALVIAISAFASRRSTVKLAVILTVTLTLFCIIVFQRLLGLPIPVFSGPFESLNPVFDALMAPFGAAANAIRSLFGS